MEQIVGVQIKKYKKCKSIFLLKILIILNQGILHIFSFL